MFNQNKNFLSLIMLMLFVFLPISVQAQLDDPTRPPGYRLVLPSGIKTTQARYFLSSVRISPLRRSAVVNDRSVKMGDIVNGAKVVAIYPSSVKLKKKGKIFTVRLVSNVVKKRKIR